MGGKEITELILLPRFKRSSLFPISEWPCQVSIIGILDYAVTNTKTITSQGQAQMIARGMVFRTLDEAKSYAKRSYS